MDFRILGPLEVYDGERRLALGGSRQRALLALLLLHAGEVVSSDRLVDELWRGHGLSEGSKALQVAVSRLRRTLRDGGADGSLSTRPPGYELRVEHGQLDLQRFEDALRDGRTALAAGDPATASEKLRSALTLWRGPPLADLAYEQFCQTEIARLEELRRGAVEDRITADLELGRHADLVAELPDLIARWPLRERPRAQLMLALYRSGRQAEALEAYQEARRALTEELGIHPGRELQELQRAVLAQDPSLELAKAGFESDEGQDATRGNFVGREAELSELLSGVEAALGGGGGLFLLIGEPGIGKTRLAEEVVRRASARGARALVGRCWEAGGAPAYWPWVQSLRAYLSDRRAEELRRDLGSGAAELAQLVPELREVLPDLPEPDALDPERARFRLFDATASFLRRAAAARPIVLVLDDLHAADEPTLLLLRYVTQGLDGSRLLIIAAARDVDPTLRDPLASTLAELARERATRRIDLRGLAEAEVGEYITQAAGFVPHPATVAAIHAQTEGNALFVAEVTRLLIAEGALEGGSPEAVGIPRGVSEVIGRRVGRLSEECRHLLTLASVLGREFGLDALEGLSGVPAERSLEVLDEAVAARLLTAPPGPQGRLRFAHALIRETLYEGLTRPSRVRLHRRAGQVLESVYERDPEPHLAELAHHYFEAAPGGDAERPFLYARRAADRALELLAYEEAARFYGLAIQAFELRQPVDRPTRCELLLARGEALAKAGNTPAAQEAFVAVADVARAASLPEYVARAALGYGGRFPFARAGGDRRLVPLLEEALEALSDDDSVLRVRLLARLGGALRDQPSLEPRSSLSRQAVEIARRLGDPETLGYALISEYMATWGPDAERLLAIAEEVSRLARDTGDPDLALHARTLQSIAWLTLGEVERATSVDDQYRALADRLNQPGQLWIFTMVRCIWALFRGELSEAEELAEQALELGSRAQSWDSGFSYRVAMFVLRREQGRLDEIEELIRRSADEYTGYRSLPCLAVLLDCELGREQDARRAFDLLAADDFAALPPDCEWLFCLCVLAEVASYLHDVARAEVLYRLLLPHARLNASVAGEVALGSVARYLGILASTTSRWGDAARHFEDALEMNASMGARPWLAHTQRDYARALLARDCAEDRERAESLLSQAQATYDELGMRG